MNKRISQVFLVQIPLPDKRNNWLPDLSGLDEFGEVVSVFESGFNPLKNLETASFIARKKFEGFDYELDYFCATTLTGPMALVICTKELLLFNPPYIKTLNWNPKFGNYSELKIPF